MSAGMGAFQNLVYFSVFLGVLITVHEAGHFFAAKWLGVKVLKFSIGFGPKLFSFRRGETEYQIAAFPLGGFVAMAGHHPGEEVAPEDAGRSFLGAPWWKRVLISSGGPVFNLLFPILAFFFVFLGDAQVASSRVGAVEPGLPAAVAGVRPGDLIVSIDGVSIRTFAEISKIAAASAGKELSVVVDRDGKKETLRITPMSVETLGLVDITRKGRMGISLAEQAAVLGVPAGSVAAEAGLRTFDRVVEVNTAPVRTIRELETALDKAEGLTALKVVRFAPAIEGVVVPEMVSVEIGVGEGAGLGRIGAEGGDAYVWEVLPNTPAAAVGIKVGDRFTSVGGQAVHSAGAVEDRLALARKRKVDIEWRSSGELHTAAVGPFVAEGNAKYCMMPTKFGVRFGAPEVPMAPIEGETVTLHLGPFDALKASLSRVPEAVMLIGGILAKLPTGEVPLESMGGPVQMFTIASQTAEAGLPDFLSALGLVSVNLALVNLLPIPILDGFSILTSLWEAVRRRPVPERAREIATYFGFVVLALLMVVAFRNDIARLLFC